MAGKSATLAIRIVSDASKASAGFDQAESKVAGFQRGLDRASVAAGGLLAGIGAAGKEAFDAASALEQSSGAVESVYGAQAAAVKAYAKDAAQANGLAASAYQDSAALIGSQLKTLGFPLKNVTKQTDGLIDTASDLAATFGGDTQSAVDALSSALKGERDPIERYGISLSQAAIDAKVAALGLDTSTDASKRNADAQAALALIAEQSASAQGSFARESDTAAGAAQRAGAEFENAKASLGEALLPVVTDAIGLFSGMTQTLTEHEGAVQAVVAVVGALAIATLAINGAMRVYAAGQALASAAVFVFNAALWANPITWVVLAIVALIGAVVLAYKKFEWFRDMVKSVWEWLKKAWDWAGKVASATQDFFTAAGPADAAGPAAGPPPAAGAAGLVYGAAAGPAPAAVYGAPLTALAGGGATAGQGAGGAVSSTVIHLTVNGAVDPMATGRQLVKILKEYGVATGGQVVVSLGGRT